MNRVLIITYHFPPRPTVGSLRPLGLARYLPEFGWEVTILTAKLPGKPAPEFKVVETQYRETLHFLRKYIGIDSEQNMMAQIAQLKKKLRIKSEKSPLDLLLAAWGEITAYPDLQKGWRKFALEGADDYFRREPVKAIISTSSPVTSHIVGKELKERYGVPWVADLRDLWTQNHYYPYSRFRRAIERRLELNTLRRADALVTISEPLARELSMLHSVKIIYVITNGFDPMEINIPERELTARFTITHTGNLYPGKQSPEPLFVAIKDLVRQGNIDASDVEIRFYGAQAGWIDKLAARYGLRVIVKQLGIVPREVALDKQRESQLLLLIKWNDPKERGVYQAKLFEYLAARRPILAIGGFFEDVVDQILHETNAGDSGSTQEAIKSILKEYYGQYQVTRKVAYKGDESKKNKYSQRQMAGEFAKVLDSVCL